MKPLALTCRALVGAFRAAGGGPIVEELDAVVSGIESLAGSMSR